MDLTPTIEPGWFATTMDVLFIPGSSGGLTLAPWVFAVLIAVVIGGGLAGAFFLGREYAETKGEATFIGVVISVSLFLVVAAPATLFSDKFYNLQLEKGTVESLQSEASTVYNLDLNPTEARELTDSLRAAPHTGQPLYDATMSGLIFGTIKKTIDGDLTELTLAYIDGEYIIIDDGEFGEELTPLS